MSDIHDVLKTHAELAGESRDPGIRVLLVAPLGIEYSLDLGTRLAYVIRVWKYS